VTADIDKVLLCKNVEIDCRDDEEEMSCSEGATEGVMLKRLTLIRSAIGMEKARNTRSS